MNRGIDAATGQYIGIVEADDYVSESMYEMLYQKANEYELDMIRSDFHRFYELYDGQRLFRFVPVAWSADWYNRLINPQTELDSFGLSMQNWTGIYKRRFLNEHSIRFNESPGASFQDNGFWFQTFMWATRLWCLNEPFYYCRRDNPASSVAQTNKVHQMLDEYVWIRAILAEYPEIEQHLIERFHYVKTFNCFYAFTLLADQYQMEFLKRYSSEYRKARSSGELDQNLFSYEDWERITQIIDNPENWLVNWRAQTPDRHYQAILERNQLVVAQYGRRFLARQLNSEGGILNAIKGLTDKNLMKFQR
jgi:glycosyltransferase involved in cell wall biosynthesis